MKTWQAAVLGMAVSVGAACGDIDTAPTQVTSAIPTLDAPADRPSQVVSPTSQTPPADAPPEYQHYTWIDVRLDVAWYDEHNAYATTIVNFGATNGTADADLTVRTPTGTVLGTSHASAQSSHVFPGDYYVSATTTVYVAPTCGSIALGQGSGVAWDSFISANQSILTWGKQSKSLTKSAAQPDCPVTKPATSSPTGGDGSTPTTSTPTYYDPTAPQGNLGYYQCTAWYLGTDYQTEYCYWVPYYSYDRLPVTTPSLSRAASSSASLSLAGADLPSVFVIVSDQVPADAMAVIERHRDGPFRNVLLVPSSSVRPAVFVAALHELVQSRARDGEIPAKDVQLTLKGNVLDQHIPAAARSYAAPFTALVASAKRMDAGAYGNRPVLELRLGK